ncbi:MAG: DedA family protein [Proteobacteria bacterium]|nr:DedA family protein [Pseudomonadota bacterium]
MDWYLGALDQGGYGLVALLMAIESSVVPLPSELVIPPAAHLAVTTGRMSLPGLVAAGALGSWVGASAMYGLARLLGRPLVVRFGRYLLVTPAKLEAAERWSAHYGPFGVFAARLLPVIRHLIGLPAGIVRLPFGRYSLVTLAGSAIWSAVLCWVGVVAGQDQALLAGDLHRVSLWLAGGVALLGVLYWVFVHRLMRPRD